jgi:hypothetical protein
LKEGDMVKKEKKQRSMKSIWGFEDNYIMVPRLLLRNARKLRLKSNHLQLILAVMDHKWDERLPFLSVETLSRETGWSTRQVQRVLKDLIAEADDHDKKKADDHDEEDEAGERKGKPPRPPLYLGLVKRNQRTRADGSRTADSFDFWALSAKLKQFAAEEALDKTFGEAKVEENAANDDEEPGNEVSNLAVEQPAQVADSVAEQPKFDEEQTEMTIVLDGERYRVTHVEIYGVLHDFFAGDARQMYPGFDVAEHGIPNRPRAALFEAVLQTSKDRAKESLSKDSIIRAAMWGVVERHMKAKGVAPAKSWEA